MPFTYFPAAFLFDLFVITIVMYFHCICRRPFVVRLLHSLDSAARGFAGFRLT